MKLLQEFVGDLDVAKMDRLATVSVIAVVKAIGEIDVIVSTNRVGRDCHLALAPARVPADTEEPFGALGPQVVAAPRTLRGELVAAGWQLLKKRLRQPNSPTMFSFALETNWTMFSRSIL